MKEFNSVEELRDDKELQNMGRYDFQKVKLNGKEVFACTTNQQYEDITWGGAYDILKAIDDKYETDIKDSDLACDIRDMILARLEEDYGIRFVDVFDEY